jgi:Uma2 family endonuclease
MSVAVADIPRRLTADAFLEWLEGRPETERWELIDGEPVRSITPEPVRHVELKRNVLEALRAGIQQRGLPCRAFGDGLAVPVDERSFFQPDASVTCAEQVDPTRSSCQRR